MCCPCRGHRDGVTEKAMTETRPNATQNMTTVSSCMASGRNMNPAGLLTVDPIFAIRPAHKLRLWPISWDLPGLRGTNGRNMVVVPD